MSKDSQLMLLRHIYGSLGSDGILLIQDIDVRPFWKYIFARAVDFILNIGQPVYYRSSAEWARMLGDIGFKVEVNRVDRGYPIAAVLLKCVKA